jgi:hypothetical protein
VVTGFIADSIEELAAMVSKAETLSREKYHREFETRFSVEAIVYRYWSIGS